MDLSKLPKMGSTPPPPPAVADDPAPVGQPGPVPAIVAGDIGTEAIIATVLGLIFMMLGASFGGWLIATLQGRAYDTGVTWTDGSPVKFFALEGGTGWLYMGEWVLGACLLIEAILCGVGLVTRRFGKGMGTLCLVLGAIGALANVVAIVMQIQMGFMQPIFSVLALAVGAMTALLHGRRVLT